MGGTTARNAARRSSGASVAAPAPGVSATDGWSSASRTNGEIRRARGSAVVARVAQDELVPGAGHRDVEEPALLLEPWLVPRPGLAEQLVRDRQRIAPAGRREPPGDEAGEEDRRELEALGLVDRQDGDRIGVGVEIGRRPDRRPPRSGSARCARRGRRPGRRRASADWSRMSSKKRATLRSASSAAGDSAPGERGQQPELAQERVEDLAGRPLVGEARRTAAGRATSRSRAARVAGETRSRPGWRPSSSRISQTVRLRRRARIDDRRQVLAAEAVDAPTQRGRRRRRSSRGRRSARRNGEQQPDLGPGVQARGAREAPRDRRPRSGCAGSGRRRRSSGRGRRGRAVRAPAAIRPADLGGDPVGLLRAGRERLVPDAAAAPAARPLGAQALRRSRPGPRADPGR